jgi:hypothetical protein
MLRDARLMVEQMLNDRALLPDDETPRPFETRYKNRELRVQTLFGPIVLRRSYYHHSKSGTGRCPLDEAIDLVGNGHTPALARLICHASTQSASYEQAAADLNTFSGLQLNSRSFARLVAEVAPGLRQALNALPAAAPPASSASSAKAAITVLYVSGDGTGVPMRREELKDIKGKQPDGSAHTREVKLGCVFTQSSTDEEGEPIRDPGSTSYVGTFEGCREAGVQLYQEALRRGYGTAQQVNYIGDGSAWVWENARLNFPGATETLDFYHASEHVGTLAKALWGSDADKAKEKQEQWCHQMKATDPAGIVQEAKDLLDTSHPLSALQRAEAEREVAYFITHAQRTRYGEFRAKGWFIGSGVIEAGCKTVVGRRLKQSGMFWSQRGGEDLVSLRCLIIGPHFDAAWQGRRNILAKERAKARRWSASKN